MSEIGNVLASAWHSPVGKVALVGTGVAGAVGISALLAGCGDNTPPPVPEEPGDSPLIARLKVDGFSNRQQRQVLDDVHSNGWPKVEAGRVLSELNRTSMDHQDAIAGYELIKQARKNPQEIVNMIQDIDRTTGHQLWGSDLVRLEADVIDSGVSPRVATNFFRSRENNGYTTRERDMYDFEVMIGQRMPGWAPSYPDGYGGVVYEPYPVPSAPNPYTPYQPDPYTPSYPLPGGVGPGGVSPGDDPTPSYPTPAPAPTPAPPSGGSGGSGGGNNSGPGNPGFG